MPTKKATKKSKHSSKAAAKKTTPASTAKTSLGIDENIEAVLAYLLAFFTGIAFLLIEKENRFVRFHAMQSTITFAGLFVLSFVLGFIPLLGMLLSLLLTIFAIILWIICLIKAYQGERFKLPIAGDLAEKHS
ncbi:DUF4870 domain-containing protein [Candidatus Woesearchaeota archaeon]|nr:MAG: DUF4870 domain-containing protein [Candidatus Woesearchaeota archaeon]